MNQLTLEWIEDGHPRTRTIFDQQPSKFPGAFRIGRDPAQCDLVIPHPTVSKLHVEIFFDAQHNHFYLRNLRATNPPLVNHQLLSQGVAKLHQGTSIQLGQLDMTVQSVRVTLAPTVLAAPHPGAAPVHHHAAPSGTAPSQPAIDLSYGLQCPKCQRVSAYDRLEVGCGWCGTSLAAAQSVLLVPEKS